MFAIKHKSKRNMKMNPLMAYIKLLVSNISHRSYTALYSLKTR